MNQILIITWRFWLFSRAKCQFRFRGTSRIDKGKDNSRHWENLSENSKSIWSWPTSSAKYNNDYVNDLSVNTNKEPSINFALLKIDITHVDQLILEKPTHTRRRWIRKNEWIEERINP